jgi:CheY-like chemotaxis protein
VVHLPTTIVAAERAASDRRFAEQPPNLEGIRVLVIEDHPDTRELVSAVLSEHGARVEAAGAAADGFDAFCACAPDVLVADIGLPGEDGYALMRRIRARKPSDGGSIPALALTAYARAEDRALALAAGFNAHLPKPVDSGELVASVASLAMGGAART